MLVFSLARTWVRPCLPPLSGAPTDAVWLGKILFDRVQRFNFRLNVDLANKSISAGAKLGYRHRYSLQGIFNDRGVIEGKYYLYQVQYHHGGSYRADRAGRRGCRV